MANTKTYKAPYSITGVTLDFVIRQDATGFYLDDADGVFRAGPADEFISSTEDSTLKGVYILEESRTIHADGKYTVAAYVSTDHDTIVASGEKNIRDDLEVNLSIDLGIILGLCLDNHVEDDIVRDASGNKLSSSLYIYNNSNNATVHDKATGLLAKVDITATYLNNKMTLLKGLRG